MSWELAVLNCLDDASKGQLMGHLMAGAQDWREAQRQMLVVQEAKIAQSVKELGEIQANRNLGGFRPEYEVPSFADAYWRAKFLFEDMEAGRQRATGRECWNDRGREGFVEWWKKRNPHLVYKESRKGNSIIVPATSHTSVAEVKHQMKVERRAAA